MRLFVCTVAACAVASGLVVLKPQGSRQKIVPPTHFSKGVPLWRPSLTCLSESSSPGSESALNNDEKQKLQDLVKRIDSLQVDIQETEDADRLEAMRFDVTDLERQANQLLSIVSPPEGMSTKDFEASISFFFGLPPRTRLALVKALGMNEDAITDVARIPEIVSKLYSMRDTLTRQVLVDSFTAAENQPIPVIVTTVFGTNETSDGRESSSMGSLFGMNDDNLTDEERQVEGQVQLTLPRVARRKEEKPNENDLGILSSTLQDNTLFAATSKPIEFSGGYILRGENRKKTGQELISALDEKLPQDWNCTVSWMEDIADNSDDIFEDQGNVLVLLKKDFSLATWSVWLYRLSSLISFGTILLFCVGVYGSNQEILDRLTNASSLNDFTVLDWFNGKVVQVLIPLLIILSSHEFGHTIVARKEKIETTSFLPTLLPMFGSLPLLGTLTQIKSSPKNFTSLYDFAFLGPLLGFVSSFIFLGTGLVATKAAMDGDGSSVIQSLPALPVSVIDLSTLGGSVIDYFFAGGDGFITNSDPATPVPLHPFAIAGYCGLLINAVEMLPVGATDGGRLALSIFGRRGHTVIGGLTWLALLVSVFSLEDVRGSLLLSAWATHNIVQNDIEVPCRDESENPNLPRIALAFALWFLATLIIVPL